MNFSKMFQGLNLLVGNRNFLLLFLARLVSSVGSAVFFVSILWMAANEMGGAASVSFILMATVIPSIILSPLAGVWADKFRKRDILVITDLISGGVLLFLGLFLGVELLQLWIMFFVVFAIQICTTLFGPALMSLIPAMVEDNNLSRANALISMTDNLSQLIGMAVGGVLVYFVGLRGAILIDGVSFILSGILEIFINAENKGVQAENPKALISDLKEGFQIMWSKIELRGLIILETLVDFFGTSIFVFMPVLASDVLKLSSKEYGFMQAMLGLGALLSTLILSLVNEAKHKYAVLSVAVVLSGLCLVSIGLFTNYIYVLVSLLVLGVMLNIATVNQTIILQRSTPEESRGRIFALRSTVDNSIRPFSYAFAGVMATRFSLNAIFDVFGIIIMINGLLYLSIPARLKEQVIRENGQYDR